MSNIRLEELIEAYENYQTHRLFAAKVARMSVDAIEYKSYLKNLRGFIKAAREKNDATLLLSTAILLPILNNFLQHIRNGIPFDLAKAFRVEEQSMAQLIEFHADKVLSLLRPLPPMNINIIKSAIEYLYFNKAHHYIKSKLKDAEFHAVYGKILLIYEAMEQCQSQREKKVSAIFYWFKNIREISPDNCSASLMKTFVTMEEVFSINGWNMDQEELFRQYFQTAAKAVEGETVLKKFLDRSEAKDEAKASKMAELLYEFFSSSSTSTVINRMDSEELGKVASKVSPIIGGLVSTKSLENTATVLTMSCLKLSNFFEENFPMESVHLAAVVESIISAVVGQILRTDCANRWSIIEKFLTPVSSSKTSIFSMFSSGNSNSSTASEGSRMVLQVLLKKIQADPPFLISMPISIFLRLPLDSSFARKSLLDYCKVCGTKLLSEENSSLVDGLTVLFENCFKGSISQLKDLGEDEWMAWYFEPLRYVLSGIAAAALQASNRDVHMQLEVQESFVHATKSVLVLTSRLTNYAGVEMMRALFEEQSDEDIVDELHKFFTSKLLSTLKDFKQCLDQSRSSIFDKTAMLQPLAEAEKKLPSLPIVYSALTAAFSERFYSISRDFLQRSGENATYLDRLLFKALTMMPRATSDISYPLSSITVGFMTSVLVDVEKAVRDNFTSLPPSLSKIPALMQLISLPTWLHYSHANKTVAARNLHAIFTKIREYLRRTVDLVMTHNLSYEELNQFRDSPVFTQIAGTWLDGGAGGAVVEHLPIIAAELAEGFAQSARVRNTFQFLSDRKMLSAGIENTIVMNADWLSLPTNWSKLSDIVKINDLLVGLLNLDEDVLKGLLSFSKGSRMFAVRFDRARTDRPRGATIADCTRRALQGLRNLVRGDGVRIEEFGESLQNVLQELRRSSTKSSELEMISNYFTGEIAGDADASSVIISKLNAAFDLVRLRQELRPFITAVREQMILSNRVVEEIENNDSVRNALGNFLLSEARAILHGVNTVLSGLTIWEVAFVGRLSKAALLLEFLRRQGRTFETSGSLQRAQNRAASNEHASSVLLTLLPLNALLQPL
eukprot:gene33971-43884_t